MRTLFAVFGNPILHSKSPLIFNTVFQLLDINAHYTRVRIENVRELTTTIRNLNIYGSNITSPFKEEVIPHLDEVSEEAKAIGAVNLVINSNGKLKGYNTDYIGVVKAVEETGLQLKGRNALILGAGGAARAAAYALVSEGATLFISNRTKQKAEALAARFGGVAIPYKELKDVHREFAVTISALLPEVQFCWDCRCDLFLDANYRSSKMARLARSKGLRVITGERWLIHQAMANFRLFYDHEPVMQHFEKGFAKELDPGKIKIGIVGVDDMNSAVAYDLIVTSEEGYRDELRLLK